MWKVINCNDMISAKLPQFNVGFQMWSEIKKKASQILSILICCIYLHLGNSHAKCWNHIYTVYIYIKDTVTQIEDNCSVYSEK